VRELTVQCEVARSCRCLEIRVALMDLATIVVIPRESIVSKGGRMRCREDAETGAREFYLSFKPHFKLYSD